MPQALTAIGVLAALLLLQLVLSAAGIARKDAEIQAKQEHIERMSHWSERKGCSMWIAPLEDPGEPWM